MQNFDLCPPGDLKTRKRTGTSCQIEIHFSIKNTKYLFKYTLLCSQIYDRFIILFIKYNHKVSASFIKEKQRYKWLIKNSKMDFYSVASSRPFAHGQIS